MELPADLLDRPAAEAVRRLALALLDRAGDAAARLADPAAEDPEALHDFRVAVRRLRSCLRAYRPQLGKSVPARPLARLRELAAASNPGRDAEVQLAWLDGERPSLRPHERTGHTWLAARLTQRRDEAYDAVRRQVVAGFSALAAKLRARLSRYRIEIELGAGEWRPQAYREVLAAAARAHGVALAEALSRVTSLADEREAHAARIAAKRLRYLLEPLATELLPAARPAVKRLRALQDLLGELNDAHLLSDEIGHAIGEAAAERARQLHDLALAGATTELARGRRRNERAGLLTLATRLAARRATLYERLAAQWLEGPETTALVTAVDALATSLGEAPAPAEPS